MEYYEKLKDSIEAFTKLKQQCNAIDSNTQLKKFLLKTMVSGKPYIEVEACSFRIVTSAGMFLDFIDALIAEDKREVKELAEASGIKVDWTEQEFLGALNEKHD